MATGHPAGLAALFAGGGWIAVPLALAIGTLAALLVRALEGVERAIAVIHAERPRRSRPPAVRGRALPARGPASLLRLWRSAWHDGRLRRHLPRQVPIRVRFALV